VQNSTVSIGHSCIINNRNVRTRRAPCSDAAPRVPVTRHCHARHENASALVSYPTCYPEPGCNPRDRRGETRHRTSLVASPNYPFLRVDIIPRCGGERSRRDTARARNRPVTFALRRATTHPHHATFDGILRRGREHSRTSTSAKFGE